MEQRGNRWVVLPAVIGGATMLLMWTVRTWSGASDNIVHAEVKKHPNVSWDVYNGGRNGDHYSQLTQIDRENVGRLRQIWTYNAGDDGGLQVNPMIIGRILYGYTSSLQVFALDATDGRQLWKFDSAVKGSQATRGFSYWSGPGGPRLFAYIANFIYALDPTTGKPIAEFGDGGRLDMRKDLRGDYLKNNVAMTTPGIVYRNLLIVGFRAPEAKPAPPGDIRAYDVLSGRLMWSFHTIPRSGEPGEETWPRDAWKDAGAANNWPGMALDEKRGIVYAPTGSAATDFYGADRVGNNLYANSLIALDATTGRRIWHFQAVHHDIWDRDFPSPPALVTVKRDGKSIDAVAETSKLGYVYLFDRVTGTPLFPIKETPFPPSDVPGEVTSPTQPIPQAPAPYARQRLTEDMLTTRTPEAHAWAVKQFRSFRSDGQFVPLSLDRQTVIFPGFDGGAEWGGPAVDPKAGVIYVNSNDIAWTGGLTPVGKAGSQGETLYQSQCAACHGKDRQGSPPSFPSLVDVGKRLSDQQIAETVRGGKGRMPGFTSLEDEKIVNLVKFLKGGSTGSDKKELEGDTEDEARYRFTGYKKFLDPEGYPAVVPPWGTLNAIDLNTGRYLWKVPLGGYKSLAAKGITGTGSENYGGPVLTASGLIIIASTIYDRKIHIFDARDGRVLWEAELPLAGVATPATYMIEGRQFIVIATSGQRDPRGPQGTAYVAFALP